jgi:hypothetical protein
MRYEQVVGRRRDKEKGKEKKRKKRYYKCSLFLLRWYNAITFI